jgi:hypothetical protein
VGRRVRCGVNDGNRVPGRHADGHIATDLHRHTHAFRVADTDADSNAHTRSIAHTDLDTSADPYAPAKPHRLADEYAHAGSNRYSPTDRNAHSVADADSGADPYPPADLDAGEHAVSTGRCAAAHLYPYPVAYADRNATTNRHGNRYAVTNGNSD